MAEGCEMVLYRAGKKKTTVLLKIYFQAQSALITGKVQKFTIQSSKGMVYFGKCMIVWLREVFTINHPSPLITFPI